MLSRFITAFLPRSKCLLISWLQSSSAVILEFKKIKSVTVSIVSPSICHEVMGPDAMILVFWMFSFEPASLQGFSSVQSLSHVQLFVTPWTTARQASLSITNSRSPPKPMSIKSVISSHPLSSPSPPALNLSQHQGLFQWVSSSHQVAKVLEFQLQHQSFQWTPRTDLV